MSSISLAHATLCGKAVSRAGFQNAGISRSTRILTLQAFDQSSHERVLIRPNSLAFAVRASFCGAAPALRSANRTGQRACRSSPIPREVRRQIARLLRRTQSGGPDPQESHEVSGRLTFARTLLRRRTKAQRLTTEETDSRSAPSIPSVPEFQRRRVFIDECDADVGVQKIAQSKYLRMGGFRCFALGKESAGPKLFNSASHSSDLRFIGSTRLFGHLANTH